MRTIPTGYIDVAASVLFVALAVAIARWQRTGEERSLVWAALRALAQLLAVGFVIKAVLEADTLLPALALIAVMLTFATQIAARRGRRVPGVRTVAAVAVVTGSVTVLAAMVVLGIIPLKAQYLVPIAGMVVGNCMAYSGIALREVAREHGRSRAEIEAALMLGAGRREALADSRRRTMRAALGPLIDSTKAVGVVTLPGVMTGMILAGVSPIVAVRLQLIVLFMLLGCTSISVLISTVLGTRNLFTERLAVRPLVEEAGRG